MANNVKSTYTDLGLFHPEDGGTGRLQNNGNYLPVYTA
jgi:hypothetical protein